MKSEIKKPTLKEPKFGNEAYDYRNVEDAGHFDGVGEAGKTGSRYSKSLNAMPDDATKMQVSRDHKG